MISVPRMEPLIHLLFAFPFFLPVASDCFFPNGQLQTNLGFAPCSNTPSDPLSSICCGVNRTNAFGGDPSKGTPRDKCLPNGICVYQASGSLPQYNRAYCTETNWKAGKCLDVCTYNLDHDYAQLTPCDGTESSLTWCCGNTTECCNVKDPKPGVPLPVTIARTFGLSTTSSSTMGVMSATPSNTPQATPEPTPQLSSHAGTSTSLSTGAKAGLGVSSAVAALALLALGFFIFRTLQAKKKTKVVDATDGSDFQGPSPYQDYQNSATMSTTTPLQYHQKYQYAVQIEEERHELSESGVMHELPGRPSPSLSGAA
ncbi:hypothetical protein GQ43DRAFT_477976 [Delitschia confertaspora ATCC 74209]|uniref:Mid2 domain-containing protein n=1 Tax=Delitschia confertaspora ATCC 74209 TaxID=1513339 RepID=A0A9P4N2E4_9PLEO|nr:hypothetical protein GQ43DRAFT_477976 [Delitschia confertaspora ATCC 74209]